ncbi:PdcA protein (plasmid) [Escherichia coli]|uniref:PdcA protein n=1 Tax=Escherichia coli TaxID=562 RepID=UPI003F92708E
MARKYKLSREALKMLLDGVSRREVKQYLVGKQIGARTAIAVLCRQEMVVLKQRMPAADKAQSVMKGVM